ncbi:hypothetical protein MKK63_22470 [Methylobacterium sp. J-088]|uniref:hypothetical protein n=1 Tax=Methylobacterium sp. J-088 TaxID=2836664 RepID=UPI001FB9666C|nr:hypothetical protein [Methylobacterium sp. J-088]MCJ2065454.1 hypothetical protein [Methylobacterium sp. J-088]
MDDLTGAPMVRLHVIAACLGIPVDSFFTGHEAAGRFVEVGQCLRLWDRIKTADGRRRALECLRELADEPAT